MQSAVASSVITHKPRIRRVAIVDDDETTRRSIGFTLRDADFEPFAVEDENLSIEAYVAKIKAGADAAICDNRLRTHGFADFDGAELAAALFRERFLTILVTTYFDHDIETMIRPFRAQLPVVRSRDELGDAESIRSALDFCVREVIGRELDESRRVYPALLNVKARRNDGGTPMVNVIVPQWNSDHAIGIALPHSPAEDARSTQRGSGAAG